MPPGRKARRPRYAEGILRERQRRGWGCSGGRRAGSRTNHCRETGPAMICFMTSTAHRRFSTRAHRHKPGRSGIPKRSRNLEELKAFIRRTAMKIAATSLTLAAIDAREIRRERPLCFYRRRSATRGFQHELGQLELRGSGSRRACVECLTLASIRNKSYDDILLWHWRCGLPERAALAQACPSGCEPAPSSPRPVFDGARTSEKNSSAGILRVQADLLQKCPV